MYTIFFGLPAFRDQSASYKIESLSISRNNSFVHFEYISGFKFKTTYIVMKRE